MQNQTFKLQANGDTATAVKASDTVQFLNGDNMAITRENNNITIATKKDVSFDGVTVGAGDNQVVLNSQGVKSGNTTVNHTGLSIKAPTQDNPDNTVTLTQSGLNNGGQRITNVAPGVDATDAVNVNQLRDFAGSVNNSFNNLNHRINDVADDANAGVSSAMAMAALPQAYIPGKSMLTGGIASYNGEGAVAVGLSKLSDNGRWVLKVSGTADTQGNAGGAVGAGFHF